LCRPIVPLVLLILTLAGCGGKSKEDLYAEAQKQLQAGNGNGAVVLLKTALEKDQNYPDARQALAKAYRVTGKFEQAEKELKKLQLLDPSRSGVALELAAIYNLTGRGDLALAEAQNFLKNHPENPEVLEVMGRGLAAKRDDQGAELNYLQALKLEPGRASAKIALASLYVAQGKEQQARALLDQVIAADSKNSTAYNTLALLELSKGHRDQALKCYQRIIAISPNDVRARYQCGMLYLDAKDTASAIKIAGDLLSQFGKRPEGHMIRGLVLYQQKNYGDAVVELEKTVQLGRIPLAHHYLGLSHYNRGEFELALAQFNKELDLNPKQYQARLLIATIWLKQKKPDEAISVLENALRIDPKNALAHNALGSAYLAKGQPDEAIKEINRALELDPGLVDAHLKKGLFSLSKGNAQQGEIELENAVRVAPELLNTRFVLAAFQMKNRQFAKAEQTFRKGITGQKSDALMYNSLAQVLFTENKEAEALQSLQKAKEVDPGYFASYFSLAQFYASKGAYEKSLNEYAGVLKRDPGNVLALRRMALSLEAKGKNAEALTYLVRAKETKRQDGYQALANFQVRRREPDKALATLEEALKAEPRNPGSLELKGQVLASQKKYPEALKCFDQLEAQQPERALFLKVGVCLAQKDNAKALEYAAAIVRKRPESAFGYSVLASVYQAQNDLARETAALKDGLKAEPGNDKVSMTLAGVYASRKDYPAALASYQDLLRKKPDYAPAVFGQGAVYEQMGKKLDAEKKYREALKKAPEYVPALNNLAYLCAAGRGNKAEALKFATRALQLQPKDGGILDTMGYALLVNGKKDDARKVLEQAVSALPRNPVVHYHLALAYRDQGNRAQALKSLQRSLELGDFPEANAAKLLLAQLKG